MSLRVLLADDSMTAQNMGKKILAEAGYDVVAVSNGAAAVKKLPEFRPDIVVADVYMPGYSGLEVCERIKSGADTARIPVLLSVGKLEPFRPEEGIKVRADGVIIKPFEATDLLAVMEKLAERVGPAVAAAAAASHALPVAQVVPPPPPAYEEHAEEPAAQPAAAAPAYDIPADAPAFGVDDFVSAPAESAGFQPDYVREFGLEEAAPSTAAAESAMLEELLAASPAKAASEVPAAKPESVSDDDFEARLAAAMAAYEEPVEELSAETPETFEGPAPVAAETAPDALVIPTEAELPVEGSATPDTFETSETHETSQSTANSSFVIPSEGEAQAEEPAVPTAWVAEEAPISDDETLSLEAEMAAFTSAAQVEPAPEPKPEVALREPVGKTTFDSEFGDIMDEANARFWAAAPPAIDEAPLNITSTEPEAFALAPEIEIEEPRQPEVDVLAEVAPVELAPAYEPVIPAVEEPPVAEPEPVAAVEPPAMQPAAEAAAEPFDIAHADEFTFGGEAFEALHMLDEPAFAAPAIDPAISNESLVAASAAPDFAIDMADEAPAVIDAIAEEASLTDITQEEPVQALPEEAPLAVEPLGQRPSYLDEFDDTLEPAFTEAAMPTVAEAVAPLTEEAAAAGVTSIDESIVAEIVYRVLDDLKPAIVAEITSQLNERLARKN